MTTTDNETRTRRAEASVKAHAQGERAFGAHFHDAVHARKVVRLQQHRLRAGREATAARRVSPACAARPTRHTTQPTLHSRRARETPQAWRHARKTPHAHTHPERHDLRLGALGRVGGAVREGRQRFEEGRRRGGEHAHKVLASEHVHARVAQHRAARLGARARAQPVGRLAQRVVRVSLRPLAARVESVCGRRR
jgi:hypothetical protein